MIDREGRVILGAFLAFVIAVATSIVIERQTGFTLHGRPLFAFLLFTGPAVVLPQLYLARTDVEPGPRSRVRFAAIATAAFAVAFADEATGSYYLLLAVIGTGSLLGLICYEALVEYRAVGAEVSFDLLDR